MRRALVVALVCVAVSAAWAEKTKDKVKKEKRFEPAVLSVAEYVGSYRGPSPEHRLVLELGPDGSLRGTYEELGRIAVLESVALEGPDFTAPARWDDGESGTLRGSFAHRVLDGVTAFGARVYGVRVPGMSGDVATFFERTSE